MIFTDNGKYGECSLVYSPDDNGYYWEELKTWRVSITYETYMEATEAYNNSAIEWEIQK